MSLEQSEKALNRLVRLLDKSEDTFTDSVPALEKKIFSRVQILLGELDKRRGRIRATGANLRKINRIKRDIRAIILSDQYLKDVDKFTKSFDTATELQTAFFTTLKSDFTQPKFINTLREVSIQNTVQALTESGIQSNIVDKAANIIRTNISDSNSFSNLMDEMRGFLTKTEESVGALQRHTSQIVTDALNTYAREYSQVVSENLDNDWFIYVGSLVEDSRDFCIALVKKKWIHRSEFTQITKGNIDVDNDGDTEKVSLQGVKPQTNASNFITFAGGFNCNHVVAPINEEFVPEKLVKRFK
ncbi:hypothetical protein LCGC14_0388540 [marine sediment metagenome]|uniref:Phage head morphogenesis domain-containing protein n=1 Tax=marine sediment metagenome TaxID=412755 RepID=A0A0F9TIC8_9ZZZZ